MSLPQFKIQGQEFQYNLEEAMSQDGFKIQSVPRPYQVVWDTTAAPGESVKKALAENPKNLLMIDKRVFELYRSQMGEIDLKQVIQIEANEENKTLDGMLEVVNFMNDHHITKAEKLVVVGGGIIQDIGGFAGAIYKRGIPWVFFPTTLLSQSDSCIGGKTGLNYKKTKNQLALFSAPRQVIINPGFLHTLTQDDIASGLGEILKLHITGGRRSTDNFQRLIQAGKKLDPVAIKELILGALAIKRSVIEIDEFELDQRRAMNYGHTLGHAIEILSEYAIPHGLAVVVGMTLVNELACRRGLLSAADRDYLNRVCVDLLPSKVISIMKELSMDGILGLLQKDKKTMGTKVSFIVVHAVGDMRFLPLNLDAALTAELTEIFKATCR